MSTHGCNLLRHTERRFCCGGCGRAFSSTAVFDAHRRSVGGRRECVDPSGLNSKGKPMARPMVVPGRDGDVTVWAGVAEE